MTTITEDYVSFEIAKLLKEKGFNEPCYACYLNKEFSHCDYLSTNFELIDKAYSAPTLQMACKWLREVHHIHIKVSIGFDGTNPVYVALYDEVIRITTDNFIDYGNSYEEAIEIAMKYCLENLIYYGNN